MRTGGNMFWTYASFHTPLKNNNYISMNLLGHIKTVTDGFSFSFSPCSFQQYYQYQGQQFPLRHFIALAVCYLTSLSRLESRETNTTAVTVPKCLSAQTVGTHTHTDKKSQTKHTERERERRCVRNIEQLIKAGNKVHFEFFFWLWDKILIRFNLQIRSLNNKAGSPGIQVLKAFNTETKQRWMMGHVTFFCNVTIFINYKIAKNKSESTPFNHHSRWWWNLASHF